MKILRMFLSLILICFNKFDQCYGQTIQNQGSVKVGNVYISTVSPYTQFPMNYPPFYGPRPTYNSFSGGYFGPIPQLYYLLPAYGYPWLTNGSSKSVNENKVEREVKNRNGSKVLHSKYFDCT